MKIELRATAFNPWQELELYQSSKPQHEGKYGATSIFVGTMRDFNQGSEVSTMFLEHYPEMTQKHLEKIAVEATQEWDLIDCLMLHRFGEIQLNDSIVLLATWSPHRDNAFKACRYLIEELKQRAPFWKKETLLAQTESRWVGDNTA